MPGYLKAAERLFSAQEREETVAMVASNPECGDLVQGNRRFS
jgi:hypothetical protein